MDSSLFSMKGDGCAVHYPDVCISVFLLENGTQGYASRNPAASMGYQSAAIKHVSCRGRVKRAAYLWLLRLEWRLPLELSPVALLAVDLPPDLLVLLLRPSMRAPGSRGALLVDWDGWECEVERRG